MNAGNRKVSLFFCEEGCDVATRDDRQDDLFRAPLERIIAIDRSLVRLTHEIDRECTGVLPSPARQALVKRLCRPGCW